MKGVILSAGVGSRFGPYTQYEHKLLLKINDIPVIDYTLLAFSRAGITDIGIVTGFMADRIADWVGDGYRYGINVRYIYNSDYKLGNALSVQVAQTFTNDQAFVLSMGDHMISSSLITDVLELGGSYEDNVLGVDFDSDLLQANDATRVQVEAKGRISSIGKHIKEWNGIDSGVFRFNSGIYEAINQWIAYDKSGRYELGDTLAYLIDQGGFLKSCNISDHFWCDVDNMEDLERLQTVGMPPGLID